MRARRVLGWAAVLVAAAVVLGACGGGSGDTSTTSAETGEGAVSPTRDATTATDAAITTGPELGGDTVAATPGSASDRCAALFSLDEVGDLFGEEAILEEATQEPALGQLLCSWGTVEDPDDLEDLASELLVVQLYSGDPIPGENFYDDSLYEDAKDLDGIGDRAFIAHTQGVDAAFVDGQVAGFLSYAAIDFGDSGAGADVTDDVVIGLLRTFHDRSV